MPSAPQEPTLFVPKYPSASVLDRAITGFPPHLMNRAAARFQVLVSLYAFTFFMSAFFPSLVSQSQRSMLFEHPANWVPGGLSIAMAVAAALTIRLARLRPAAVTVLALAFEVVSSYGIAAAEFLQPRGLNAGVSWVGLSWVSVWVLLFNVVVPTVPRYAVFAALASVTSVPVMVRLSIATFPTAAPLTGPMIFWAFVFPYALVVIMAYVGARVIYSLGTEVARARELGSYRLEHRLGEGGMGEVWKASHRLLARPAAIKLIRSSVEGKAAGISDDMRRRFEREAQVIAQLRSPHTVGDAVRLRRR
jgi:serine/threonine-protein kinase